MMSHVFVAAALVAGLAAPPQAPEQPPQTPEAPPLVQALLKSSRQYETAGQLLADLEQADENLTSLQARLLYTRTFFIASDQQTRLGTLRYQTVRDPATGEPSERRFAIEFDTLRVAERQERLRQSYIFDGEWVVEKLPEEKQFTKRQVVPPGQRFDPLRIGEGPFPVPIGQRREDVLARFEASLAEPGDGLEDHAALAKFATEREFVQLLLRPRPGTPEAEDFDEIRVWYDPGTPSFIPRIARTVDAQLDESLVVLAEPLAINAGVSPDAFDTTPPPPGEGWQVHVEPWRAPTGGGGQP